MLGKTPTLHGNCGASGILNTTPLQAHLSQSLMSIESMPLFPLNTVLFPDGHLPLQIFEVRYLDLIRRCLRDNSPFGVITLLDGQEVRRPDEAPLFSDTGTLAFVDECEAPLPTLLKINTRGSLRYRLHSVTQEKNGLWVGQIERLNADPDTAVPEHLEIAAHTLEQVLDSLTSGDVPPEQMPIKPPYRFQDSGWVANRWCELLPLQKAMRLQLLALDNPLLRLELINDVLEEQGLA